MKSTDTTSGMAMDLDVLRERLRTIAEAPRLRAIAPELSIEAGPLAGAQLDDTRAADARELAWLRREGFARLTRAATADEHARLARAIGALTEAHLPAVFVYAFDETWRLGERVRARVSAMFERPFALLHDAWAWRIAPGRGRGWPAHRGVSTRLDRAIPEILNVWVALLDAPPERACMHFVPLDDDPGYPDALERLDAPLEATRSAPLVAGDALVWNANTLHWGGPCSARAEGPRVSCSFSLGLEGYDAGPRVDVGELSLEARVDLIAAQIVTYGEGQPDVLPPVLEWGRATDALRRLSPEALTRPRKDR